MTQEANEEVLLICDLNVFVMAYILNSSIMLNGTSYSFGKIFIHETVLDELLEWRTSTAKKRKFGDSLIESMISKCEELVISKPILAEQEKLKYFRRIKTVEGKLSEDEKSSDTSTPDKTYLSLAIKLNANLVTQEKTLRSIGINVIGERRLFNFSQMIIDRVHSKDLKKDDVKNGLDNLSHYEENFIKGNRKKILAEIERL